MFKIVFNRCNSLIINANCGDGRTRTAVQTSYQAAFYTLILSLVFDCRMPEGRPTAAYPLGAWQSLKESLCASDLNDTPWSGHNRLKVRRNTRRERNLDAPD